MIGDDVEVKERPDYVTWEVKIDVNLKSLRRSGKIQSMFIDRTMVEFMNKNDVTIGWELNNYTEVNTIC